MRIALNGAVIRPWLLEDVDSLAAQANNKAVSRHLRDIFPHPYTRADAQAWIQDRLQDPHPIRHAAICVDDLAVGAISVEPGADVSAHVWELGYWLGQEHWGKGIMTEAVQAYTRYVFSTFPCTRIHAGVFGWNPASARVLEKAGYTREGTLRRDVLKDGEYTDRHLYAILLEEAPC